MTETRAEEFSRYGVSMYTTAAATTPGPRTWSVRNRNRTPTPARKMIDPSQSRCATQAGTPIASKNQ